MSTLRVHEKLKLEKAFAMGGGYVLDFTNQAFEDFVLDSVRIDIYDAKYNYRSGSKANRLRAFWREEPDYLVAVLTSDLLQYCREGNLARTWDASENDESLLRECSQIVLRLQEGGPLEQLESLEALADDMDYQLLFQSIRESVIRSEPQVALDRLHTFMVAYTRILCDKHGLSYNQGIPLNGLLGKYVKHLMDSGHIESEMTERILKTSISILDSYNKVRNDQSFAHDNPILNQAESELIISNIVALVRFLQALEESSLDAAQQEEAGQQEDETSDWDEIPF